MYIPTASELFEEYSWSSYLEDGGYATCIGIEDFEKALIDFAKLHVQAALESAYKNSIMYKDLGEGEDGKICYEMGDIFYDEYDYPIAISKNSILDAYSLENIK